MGDESKEDFSKYLEHSGVMDALTQTLVEIYENPERRHKDDGLQMVVKHLTNVAVDTDESKLLQKENAVLKEDKAALTKKIGELNDEIEALKAKLAKCAESAAPAKPASST
eukprot:TRINITY_DN5912_c0_g1_i1.p1 TRINITY_DN5912_c0_g1~~TRINITY_DN5912_c0_g1_i1.p1  ORF type:complete len:124 (-),score=29.35 TRINITY_DN5912_c0_g1_i1:36-368(-)